ncbi:hypothetical protein OR16_19830 [Cupriavidus basilensis OR16]|uniref:Uncharacterized protein n=1 Tax=Cupriavidus basilensis OR16 TaxID=1127483 RepID=H1S7N4_9BURK|nr:hypothetical protein OR16_19830 [Cupriavidus basilensis OR16]
MLMMLRPCSLSSSSRSDSILETMAVDDMASAPPSATEACQDSGNSQLKAQLAGITASSDNTTCEPPRPNTCRFIALSLPRLNSRPIENIKKTTPNSARYLVCAVSLARPSACGPIRMPTTRYPSMGGNCSMRNATTPNTAAASRTRVRSSGECIGRVRVRRAGHRTGPVRAALPADYGKHEAAPAPDSRNSPSAIAFVGILRRHDS